MEPVYAYKLERNDPLYDRWLAATMIVANRNLAKLMSKTESAGSVILVFDVELSQEDIVYAASLLQH